MKRHSARCLEDSKAVFAVAGCFVNKLQNVDEKSLVTNTDELRQQAGSINEV